MEFQKLPENYKEMRLSPYKKDFSHSYVFGLFPVIELADNLPGALFRIAASSKLTSENLALLEKKALAAGAVVVTDDRTVERLSPKDNCFAVGAFRKFFAEIDTAADHIVLVNPSDKGNLGNIVRTAVAFGFTEIVTIGACADIFDPHTVRASMGALFRIRPSHFSTFEEYAEAGGKRNYYPFMLNGSPMESCVPDKRLPCSLIFGNESSGLDGSFLNIGKPLRIMHGSGVDSLNLTVAAGIGMHWFAHSSPGTLAR
ncbi:MAG: TrmH family RNA methyltransferase [Clostridia bacterium]|nr:TrmH family RNA methyltransferase [Clostridia bacterium]